MLYCIMGESACGKDTIYSELCSKHDFNTIVQATTRPKRPGEIDGENYFYISNQLVYKLIATNSIAELRKYTIADGTVWKYMTFMDDIKKVTEKDDFLVVASPLQFKAYYSIIPEKVIPIVLYVEDWKRLIRMLNRDHSQNIKELCRRFADDLYGEDSYKGVSPALTIKNDDIDWTVSTILSAIQNFKEYEEFTLHKDLTPYSTNLCYDTHPFGNLINVNSEYLELYA